MLSVVRDSQRADIVIPHHRNKDSGIHLIAVMNVIADRHGGQSASSLDRVRTVSIAPGAVLYSFNLNLNDAIEFSPLAHKPDAILVVSLLCPLVPNGINPFGRVYTFLRNGESAVAFHGATKSMVHVSFDTWKSGMQDLLKESRMVLQTLVRCSKRLEGSILATTDQLV
ncbi:MAG: hypothetical protein WC477_04585 [Patescibacteria group bacterium]